MRKTILKSFGFILIGLACIVLIYPKQKTLIDYDVYEVHLRIYGENDPSRSYTLAKEDIGKFINFLNQNVDLTRQVTESKKTGGLTYYLDINGDRYEKYTFFNGYFYHNNGKIFKINNFDEIISGVHRIFQIQ